VSARGILREIGIRAVALVGGALVTGVLSTVRVRSVGDEHYRQLWERGEPFVIVLWHGRLLPCTWRHRGRGIGAVISQNRDGEYIARLVRRWGYHPVRGSSSRGGSAALREVVRLLRDGRSVAITPDGPRGPRERMKPGALLAAQLAGTPIVPVAAGATRAWWFGRWDRFLVPKPFSRVTFEYGAPIRVPRDLDEAGRAELEAEVEARLGELMRRVDAAAAGG
jgi:lysophospholipid acyltransferase (LPLAT)-like uncharacterized protein